MKKEFGYHDEILNQFKLIIYNWDINKVIKYYQNDSFCCDYCIDKSNKYGCLKEENECLFEHSQTINLYNLIFGNSQHKPHYKMATLLCLYLMYKRIYNDKNSQLFQRYGELLRRTGTTMQDYLKSEKFYLKSINIDNDNGYAHNNYALLLNNKLNNFDKAEYHYKKAVDIDPKSVIRNYNFACFLKNRQKKYSQSLIYINNACELEPNVSIIHQLKGQILSELNNFEESIDETILALKLNGKDGKMNKYGNINNAKQLIEESIKKFMIKELNVEYYFNESDFEGYKLIEWLYDNQLLSIKGEILSSKMSLSMLKQTHGVSKVTLGYEDEKTSSYESKYNQLVEQVEALKKENGKLKQVTFRLCFV